MATETRQWGSTVSEWLMIKLQGVTDPDYPDNSAHAVINEGMDASTSERVRDVWLANADGNNATMAIDDTDIPADMDEVTSITLPFYHQGLSFTNYPGLTWNLYAGSPPVLQATKDVGMFTGNGQYEKQITFSGLSISRADYAFLRIEMVYAATPPDWGEEPDPYQ